MACCGDTNNSNANNLKLNAQKQNQIANGNNASVVYGGQKPQFDKFATYGKPKSLFKK
jgi:hypothetical protein